MIYPFSMGARVVYLDRPPTASALMPALRAIRPDGHADRAADHRENLPPPGARQVQFQLLLAHALPHRLHAPLPPPCRGRETDEALRRPSALPGNRGCETRRRGREIPARSPRPLCHRLRADRDRAAAGRRGPFDGAAGIDRSPGPGRRTAAGERQPRDPSGRDRGPHAERRWWAISRIPRPRRRFSRPTDGSARATSGSWTRTAGSTSRAV